MALGAASVVLWIVTLFVWPYVQYQKWDADTDVETARIVASLSGGLSIQKARIWKDVNPPERTAWEWGAKRPLGPNTLRMRFGMRMPGTVYYDYRAAGRFDHALIFIPYWLLFLSSLPLPAAWWLRRRHVRRRRAAGCCLSCGYDLSATPQGGRCPECGTPRGEVRAM